jgi:hypothetical protein
MPSKSNCDIAISIVSYPMITKLIVSSSVAHPLAAGIASRKRGLLPNNNMRHAVIIY